jgi:hypothetical protein
MKWLASLSDQEFQTLLATVSTEDDSIQSRTQLVKRIQDAVSEAPSRRGAELVTELYSLIGLNVTHGWPIEEVLDKATSSRTVELEDKQKEILRRRLIELSMSPIVNKLARAANVYSEHAKLLHTAQVISDIRPVFDDASDGSIVGAVIAHTLILNYHSASGREELYVALDDVDLEELADAIARARSQSQQLEKLIKSAGLADLSRSAQ